MRDPQGVSACRLASKRPASWTRDVTMTRSASRSCEAFPESSTSTEKRIHGRMIRQRAESSDPATREHSVERARRGCAAWTSRSSEMAHPPLARPGRPAGAASR